MPDAPTIDDLIFVGLRGYAIAVHRDTGAVVWTNSEMNSGYTSVLLDGDRLVVSTNGYLYCLDPLTGQTRWRQPLKGYGTGVTSLASSRGTSGPIEPFAADAAAEQARRNQQQQQNRGHHGAA